MDYKKKSLRSNLITYALVVAFYVFCEALLRTGNMSSLTKGLLVPFCYYAIVAVALNLVVGTSGELSLGHAGFMCVGAFSSAIFAVTAGANMPTYLELALAVLIGAVSAGIAGFLIGIPVLRLKGDYLAIVTLAFGEIIKNVINAVYLGIDSNGVHFSLKDAKSMGLADDGTTIIKGAQGIGGLPRNASFTVGIILVLITLFIVLNLINSRHGRAIMAIRDNRIAAEATGLSVSHYKMLAFTVSAAIAGVAGVLYSHNLANLQATSKSFGYNQSIMILVFVVLGGIGSVRGSLIAAVLLTLLPEKLRFLSNYRMLIYAVVLIAIMIFNSSPKVVEWRKMVVARLNRSKRIDEAVKAVDAQEKAEEAGANETSAQDAASSQSTETQDKTAVQSAVQSENAETESMKSGDPDHTKEAQR